MPSSKQFLILDDGVAALTLIGYAMRGVPCAHFGLTNCRATEIKTVVDGCQEKSKFFLIGDDGKDSFYIAVPSTAKFSMDFSFYWSRLAQSLLTKQYTAYCSIAVLQTLGGGWASVRRVDKALQCACLLYYYASMVNNKDICQKCHIFIGWSFLWRGNTVEALRIFHQELANARRNHDIVHERRCLHAITHAQNNPTLTVKGFLSKSAMADMMTDVFTLSSAGNASY